MQETHATNKLMNLINTEGNRLIISITANCNVLHVQEYEVLLYVNIDWHFYFVFLV